VVEHWGDPPLFSLDRAHVPLLGVQAFGVHLNGIVRRPDGLHMWIARRADDREVAPGKLDNMVAGGQPVGLGLMENVIKECAEEAGLGPDLAGRARPAGLVSYCLEAEAGLKPDTLFVYDLDLPEDVTPVNQDGEIAAFMLWPLPEVLERLSTTQDFKYNVPHVILDFAIRHGVITPEETPDYLALVQGLRRAPVRFHPDTP
jgi:8-oxo-dGTP pyrophosphatase MutT (NUDIX family)